MVDFFQLLINLLFKNQIGVSFMLNYHDGMNKNICFLMGYGCIFFVYGSIFGMLALSIDRLLATKYPIWLNAEAKKK